jgi:hypothetical protein
MNQIQATHTVAAINGDCVVFTFSLHSKPSGIGPLGKRIVKAFGLNEISAGKIFQKG